MIVRDEEHVIRETLDSVAPHIDHWVIVDTGSTDDTIATVESHMAGKGIPGEVHRRAWRDFGSNRTEALELCRGKGDYAWVIDADDLVIGDLDLSGLVADSYLLRYGEGLRYWRKQIFRDGLRWRYEGVVHEYPRCLDPASEARLEGDYHVESRRLGARNDDPAKYRRDADLLEGALERDPTDERAMFYLAQSLFDAGDHRGALERYTERAEMGGWAEERFYSLWRRGQCLELLEEEPWSQALEAHLEAWAARPSRAEPLHAIARHYRESDSFELGHLFATRAAEIPYPEADSLFVAADVYSWRAKDERAICAYYVGRFEESFELSCELLEGDALPEAERDRVQRNRDLCVPALQEKTEVYPEETVAAITGRSAAGQAAADGGGVTVTITSCRRLALFERTVNSFLNCCTDLERVARWVCVDNGSTESDRARMKELYPFFEFVLTDPARGERHPESMNRILGLIETPWWLHLEDDWHFFWRGPYIGRALDVMEEDGRIAQVAFNVSYGETLECRRIDAGEGRRTRGEGTPYRLHEHIDPATDEWERYLGALPAGSLSVAYWPHFTLRPSLIRAEAIASIRPFETSGHFELEGARRFAGAGHLTAFFDQITCLHLGRLTSEGGSSASLSAYELVGDGSHPARPIQPARSALPDPEIEVINLSRRADRWESFGRMARRAAGPGFAERCRRVEAVDGLTLRADPELERLFRGNDFGSRRGIVGCALSHIARWRSLAADEDGVRLILEDDVELVDGFERRFAAVCERLSADHPGFDLALLGHLTSDAGGRGGARVLRPMSGENYIGGLYAYVLSSRGARRLLEIAERDGVQNGIDTFVVLKAGELEILECVPPLASASMALPGNSVDSDIQRDFEAIAPGRAAGGGRRLADLAPTCVIAEIRLEAEPGWVCRSASVTAGPEGMALELDGATNGSTSRGYLVRLDDLLEVSTVAPLEPAADADGEEPLDLPAVPVKGGLLSIAAAADSAGDGGAHRFVLTNGDGDAVATTPSFTLTVGDGALASGLAERDGELVVAFVTAGGAPMIAALETEDALAALAR